MAGRIAHAFSLLRVIRVKLPKTFLAVNLSDAFTFQEKPQNGEAEDEMKSGEHEHPTTLAPPEPVDEE